MSDTLLYIFAGIGMFCVVSTALVLVLAVITGFYQTHLEHRRKRDAELLWLGPGGIIDKARQSQVDDGPEVIHYGFDAPRKDKPS